jgi:hypothetical protein
MNIELTQTQVELLREMVFEEILRVQSSNMQYKGNIIASLKSLEKKLKKQ